jgi:hypothetical protein
MRARDESRIHGGPVGAHVGHRPLHGHRGVELCKHDGGVVQVFHGVGCAGCPAVTGRGAPSAGFVPACCPGCRGTPRGRLRRRRALGPAHSGSTWPAPPSACRRQEPGRTCRCNNIIKLWRNKTFSLRKIVIPTSSIAASGPSFPAENTVMPLVCIAWNDPTSVLVTNSGGVDPSDADTVAQRVVKRRQDVDVAPPAGEVLEPAHLVHREPRPGHGAAG